MQQFPRMDAMLYLSSSFYFNNHVKPRNRVYSRQPPEIGCSAPLSSSCTLANHSQEHLTPKLVITPDSMSYPSELAKPVTLREQKPTTTSGLRITSKAPRRGGREYASYQQFKGQTKVGPLLSHGHFAILSFDNRKLFVLSCPIITDHGGGWGQRWHELNHHYSSP